MQLATRHFLVDLSFLCDALQQIVSSRFYTPGLECPEAFKIIFCSRFKQGHACTFFLANGGQIRI